MRSERFWAVACCLLFFGCDATTRTDAGVEDAARADAGEAGPSTVTILRDEYGVPHIYADDPATAAHAWGWVEAEDGGLALMVYLFSVEGRSLERFGASCGETCLGLDSVARLHRIPEALSAGYDSLAPRTREHLSRYADGLNAYYASVDPSSTVHRAEDPITPQMIVGAMMLARIEHAIAATQGSPDPLGGSNQFAVTGARTAADTTLLVKDPHNGWTSAERYVHVRSGDLDIVGNAGNGVLSCGSTSAVGFGCTRAHPAAAIYVEVELRYLGMQPDDGPCGDYLSFEYGDHLAPGGYAQVEPRCIDVPTGDSGLAGANWVYETRFGPIVATEDTNPGDPLPDRGVVQHVFAGTDPTVADYFVDRTFAASPAEAIGLYAAATPREDAQYRAFAGADGDVGIVLGASTPGLDPSVDWTSRVSSTDPRIDAWTPNAEWREMAGVEWYNVDGAGLELPSVRNPDGDFVQNCNGNPTYATEPIGQVGSVPVFLEDRRGASRRDQVLRGHLVDALELDAAGAMEIALSIESHSGRALGEALACGATAQGLSEFAGTYGDAGVLLQQLMDWEAGAFEARPTSTAMTVLFLLHRQLGAGLVFPDRGACLTRPEIDALASALNGVATYMASTYADQPDPLRVPWGYVNHTTVGGVDYGLPGGAGTFGILFVRYFGFDEATGRSTWDGGTRVPQVSAWTPSGFETWISVPHGQIDEASFPQSPHVGQTIDDFVARRFRRVWLDVDEVRDHLCPWGDPDDPLYDPAHEHPTVTTLEL